MQLKYPSLPHTQTHDTHTHTRTHAHTDPHHIPPNITSRHTHTHYASPHTHTSVHTHTLTLLPHTDGKARFITKAETSPLICLAVKQALLVCCLVLENANRRKQTNYLSHKECLDARNCRPKSVTGD